MRPDPFVHDRDTGRRFFAFDMFGTLVVNTIGTTQPIFDVMCTYYPGIDPDEIGAEYVRIKKEFKETHKNKELPIDTIIRRIDERFGTHNDPDEMEQPMLRHTRIYGPAPGAKETLGYLKDNGYRIGVMSNTRYHHTTLEGILEDYGMLGYIDRVVTSADLGIRKPEPFVYDSIAEALGGDVRHCFYCGDSDSKDYYGPLAAGMKGAALIDPEMKAPVRWKIRSIGDLPSLFEGDRS